VQLFGRAVGVPLAEVAEAFRVRGDDQGDEGPLRTMGRPFSLALFALFDSGF
jgi:hypothetical protein